MMNQKVVDLTPTTVIQHGIEFKKVRGYQRKPLNYFADASKSSSFIAIAVCRSKGIIHSMTLSELKVVIRSGSYQAWLPNHIHTVPKTNILR